MKDNGVEDGVVSAGAARSLADRSPSDAVTLRGSVERALEDYFAHLEDQPSTDLYELVLSQVEQPLLEYVLQMTGGNQSKTAMILGINRGTLRNKMKKYCLL